jgi:hypothetical protein
MSKSNHQKYGFHPRRKGDRRDKDFVRAKTFIAKTLKYAKWNGTPIDSLFPCEVGRVESIRFVETGG